MNCGQLGSSGLKVPKRLGGRTQLLPVAARNGRLLVVERWQNQESLAGHLRGERAVSFERWLSRIKIDPFASAF